MLEAKKDDIGDYQKLYKNIQRGKSKCSKMLAAVTQNDAKTLNKAELDNDLERYTSRTIGMYKIAVKELERKKNREKRAAQKANGEQSGEKSTPKPKAKPATVSGGGAASSDKAQTKVI